MPSLLSTSDSQFGAKRGISTAHAYTVVVEKLKQFASNKNAQILSIDLKQAYDNVNTSILLNIMKKRIKNAKVELANRQTYSETLSDALEIFLRYITNLY